MRKHMFIRLVAIASSITAVVLAGGASRFWK
jgi:hypothetical protein